MNNISYIGILSINLRDLVVSNGFLGITPKVQTTKVKIDNRGNEIVFSHKKVIKF